MDTPIGFERWEPGHPWGDVVFADGSKTSVMDEDGSIEAEARGYGARFNAQPKAAPEPAPQPALTGAASPPLPASTPSPEIPASRPMSAPSAPPLPSGAPPTAAEQAPLQASPADLQALSGPPRGVPSTTQSPAAQALADHGIAPGSLGKAPDPMSPALAAIQQHAPQLVAGKGEVKVDGPDAESAANIRGGSDLALKLKGQAIDQGVDAKGQNLQDQAALANQQYFDAWKKQNESMGQMGALTQARDQASAKLAQVKQAPIADHPDFPDWFVATSILGSIAGGFAEGFSGGRYKSTTLPMLHQIISDWKDNQKYNKSNLISSLEQQLGDRNAAVMAAGSRIKDELANQAEAQAKYARTVEARRELTATATGLRASALEDWTKTQAVVMGKVSSGLSLEKPPQGAGYTNATLEQLKGIGITPEMWDKGLDKEVFPGKESASVRMAAQTTKQIDADIADLQSIMAANGNTLPTKGVINIPQALVPVLSRSGYKPGMQAEDVTKIINTYLTQKAKSYGGVITESDRASAALEFGSSGEGFIKGMGRLRDSNNTGIRGALSQVFPGREQQALNILLERSSAGTTPGVPNPPVAPLEKQNVEHTGPADQQFPETPLEKENREAMEKRKGAREELLAQPEVKKQQEERERLPIGQRFSPF